MKNSIINSFFWKLLERFGVSGVQFILQLILARLLDPEHYGVLSIMIIFTNLANVFIQTGFNTSLIQNKDVEEDDYSSVFWITFVVAIILYIILYLAAPLVAGIYNMPNIVIPFRVLAIILFPGALNSIQVAKISREMNFKKIFTSNILACVVSGIIGICLAYMGAGIWALVIQNILNISIATIVMLFTVQIRIRVFCNIRRIKFLFSFGSKILVATLIETVYQDIRSLVIGKKYNSTTLGFYNRGKQFPQFIISAINGTVQSVMLPAMSEQQDNNEKVKEMMRNAIGMSAYIVFPMMFGLAATSNQVVSLLLTEKWLPCVPFMQIYCISFALYPINSSNLQAINAMGRSDILLKLEVIKKIVGILILAFAVFYFDTPIAIAISGIIGGVIGWFINAYPNRKLIDYKYSEQVFDVFPSLMLSILMYAIVYAIGLLIDYNLITLLLQIIVGVVSYILLSFLLKPQPFRIMLNYINKIRK